MSTRTRDMTMGNPLGLLVRFSVPLMIGGVFQQLYTIVDTMVVGKVLGVQALAAVGAVEWLNWMIVNLIQSLMQGFAILIAQEFGAKRIGKLKDVLGSSIVMAALAGGIFLLFGQGIAAQGLRLLQIPKEIIGNSLLYVRVLFCGIPVVTAYNLFACILRSLGDSQTPLRAMAIASVINIALDLLFVLVLGWGIAGAAIATVLAQVSSAGYCWLRLRGMDLMALTKAHYQVKPLLWGEMLKLSLPVIFQTVVIAVGGLVLQGVINSFGVLYVAAYTATNKILIVMESCSISYGYAMLTYTGQNYGASKFHRIRQGVNAGNLICLITSLVLSPIAIIWGREILLLFISGSAAEVQQTIEIAYVYLQIISYLLPVLYTIYIVRSALQAIGDTVIPMVSGIVELVMRVGGALLLPMLFAQVTVFFSGPLAWFGANFILYPVYFYRLKKLCAQEKK